MKKIQVWILWCMLMALTCPCIAANSVEWVNVKDYGAKADGKADDTQAIQKALNAAVDTICLRKVRRFMFLLGL